MRLPRLILLPMALLAGCIADESVDKPDYNGLFHVSDAAALAETSDGTNAQIRAEDEARAVWTVEELARRAGQRCGKSKEGALKVALERLKAAEAVAWKAPEFRYGHAWGDEHAAEDDFKTGVFSDTQRASGSPREDQYQVRLYIPNPFVNRYLRRVGAANVATREAQANSESFAVYVETKLLCNELLLLEEQVSHGRRKYELCTNLVALQQRMYETGVAKTPYELLRARNRCEMAERRLVLSIDARRRVQAAVALLAELPSREFTLEANLDAELPELPADVSTLCEIAFSRRPDLTAALQELESAEARVGVAKAELLPWFRFVEGTYADGRRSESQHGSRSKDHSRSSSHEREYGVQVALTVPIFDWCGNKVSLAKSVRARATDRVDALYRSISNEVDSAVAEYRILRGLSQRTAGDAFIAEMRVRIGEVDRTVGHLDEEKCLAELELVDLEFADAERLSAAHAARLRLESVIGGPFHGF